MIEPTSALFLEDAYLRECEAKVVHINEMGGIILDQTNFYATSGGQPGDSGQLQIANGSEIEIAMAVKDKESGGIALVPAPDMPPPAIGEKVICKIDWQRRFKLMQMHTACHILSVVCPYPITSANVGETESRVDFDMQELPSSKQEISAQMMALINGNHEIFNTWIEEAQLDANPDLVKSKNVKPPRGIGRIRLVCIGESSTIDSQPCGGTHVQNTSEIGEIHIGKIEKKGRENRRFRIRFGPMPDA